MAKEKDHDHAAATRDVIITRVFNAPRALVFKAWTDPAHLQRWYAPQGCTISIQKIDVRPGGTFHHCIHNPKFGDCWCTGTFLEIVAPERLVYTIAVSDEAGNLRQAADVGMDPDWPSITTVTVTFIDLNNKTLMKLHQTAPEALAIRTGAHPSWLEMMDRLDAELQTDNIQTSLNVNGNDKQQIDH